MLLLALLISLIINKFEPNRDNRPDLRDFELIHIREEVLLPEPPPLSPLKQEPPPEVKLTNFTPTVIVKDNQVKIEDILSEVQNLEEKKIDIISLEGINDLTLQHQ